MKVSAFLAPLLLSVILSASARAQKEIIEIQKHQITIQDVLLQHRVYKSAQNSDSNLSGSATIGHSELYAWFVEEPSPNGMSSDMSWDSRFATLASGQIRLGRSTAYYLPALKEALTAVYVLTERQIVTAQDPEDPEATITAVIPGTELFEGQAGPERNGRIWEPSPFSCYRGRWMPKEMYLQTKSRPLTSLALYQDVTWGDYDALP